MRIICNNVNYSKIKTNALFILMQCYEHILLGYHMTHPPADERGCDNLHIAVTILSWLVTQTWSDQDAM
jgi:hypothetical protein